MSRWPALILLVALFGGLVLADVRADDGEADDAVLATAPSAVLTGGAGSGSGSTWYCPAGFTTPDLANDHLITVTNRADTPAIGSLTLYPSLFDTLGDPVVFDRAVQPLLIAPGSQQSISLAPLVASLDELLATNTGAFVGALAEFDGSGVTVEHTVVSPQGRGGGACATTAGARWWFASGTTTADVRHQLYLLNPFADDAVVDVGFVTDGGSRNPTAFKGRLVPAQSLTVLDVSPVVSVWPQVTTEVTTRTGRVIAERIQVFDNEAGPTGLSLTLGANELSEQWFFPAGRAALGAGESYLIFNPTEEPAEVEFELKPDSADRAGDVAPLPVTVGPRERWVVNVAVHDTHPVEVLATVDASTLAAVDERFFVTIRSFNGVPVVAERIITRPLESGPGVSASLGATVASTEQLLGLPARPVAVPPPEEATGDEERAPAPPSGTLAILNPAGNTIAQVEVWVGGPDGETLRADVELAPRRRAVYELDALGVTDERWIRVRSSTGTIAELVGDSGGGLMASSATPTDGTVSTPELYAFD